MEFPILNNPVRRKMVIFIINISAIRKVILLLLSLLNFWSYRCIAQQPGDLDNSFGIGGKVAMPDALWTDVAVQADGRIVVVSDIVARYVARYKVDGTLDSTFGTAGIDTIKIGSAMQFTCNAIGIQPDGKILVVGGTIVGNVKDIIDIVDQTGRSLLRKTMTVTATFFKRKFLYKPLQTEFIF